MKRKTKREREKNQSTERKILPIRKVNITGEYAGYIKCTTRFDQ